MQPELFPLETIPGTPTGPAVPVEGAGISADRRRPAEHRAVAWEWEHQYVHGWRRIVSKTWRIMRGPVKAVVFCVLAVVVGVQAASVTDGPMGELSLQRRLAQAEAQLKARQGELELARLELGRTKTIMEASARYRIPSDLAADIYDIALAEGIRPEIAYGLVSVESEFSRKAVSPVGAIGLTQVMPATAFRMDPGLTYDSLFHRETNLRLGFRFLRTMLDRYDGDMRLALLAYNRGPAIVDSIRSRGGNPENGYTGLVLGGK